MRAPEFMSSPFTPERAEFLCEKLQCRSIKIASGLITNTELLDVVNANASYVKRVFLSTGMSTPEEISSALGRLDRIEQVVVMHCVTAVSCSARASESAGAYPHWLSFSRAARLDTRTIPLVTSLARWPWLLAPPRLRSTSRSAGTYPAPTTSARCFRRNGTDLCSAIELIEKMLGCGNKCPLPEELQIRDIARHRFKDNLPA